MKIFLIAGFLLFQICLPPTSVFAHAAGQPPFLQINGVYTNYYPVPTNSNPEFNLPQDIARENFLVGQVLNFEIITSQLPAPKEVIEKTKFSWDFADGERSEGLKTTHSYSKMGSYIITVYADSGDGVGGQLLQSTLINIIPSENYQLPKAVIEINGWQTKDPLTDILVANFKKEFVFDGSKSESTSQILEHTWDLGDGEIKNGQKITYFFNTNPYTVFPVLRIRNSDGFIADSFVQIKEQEALQNNPGQFIKDQLTADNPRDSGPNLLGKILIGAGILIGLYITGFFILKFFKKN